MLTVHGLGGAILALPRALATHATPLHWYDHAPKGVVESGEIKVLWDFMIQCDHHIECRKPDIVVVEKEEKKCLIVDIAIPDDKNVGVKEEEKVQKYDELKWEIKEFWSMKRVDADIG